MDEEKKYYLDQESLSKLVEALLTKIKQAGSTGLTRADFADDTEWEIFLLNLFAGYSGAKDKDAITVGLLSEILSAAKYTNIKYVSGVSINTAVEEPAENTFYVFDNTEDDADTTSVWTYDGTKWVNLTGHKIEVNIPYIDVSDNEDVNNVIAHINRAETSYVGSLNVKAEDVITVQALTNIMVGLKYGKRVDIPYKAENEGKLISEVVPKPDVTAIYSYQQSSSETDWAVYTVVPVTKNDVTKYTWIQINGGESGASEVEVNLQNYWSKDELVPLTAEDIESIVESAAEKVGF